MFIAADNLCFEARIRKLFYEYVLPSWVRRRRDEEEAAYRDLKLGLDKVDGPVSVKPIALGRVIMTTRELVLLIRLGE